jgi:hypothetical protein
MHCDYKARHQARASLFDYTEVFYNRQRRHSTINYMARLPFEKSTSAGSDCPLFVGPITFNHTGLESARVASNLPSDAAL